MSEQTELKPCPHCGGEAKLEQMGYPHHVFCTNCYARVTGTGFGSEGERSAIEAWNRRAGDELVGKCDGCINTCCESCLRSDELCDCYEGGSISYGTDGRE